MVQGREELDPENLSGQFNGDLKEWGRGEAGGWAMDILHLAMSTQCGMGICHAGMTNAAKP